jgi:spore photoproduct lyase
MGLLGLNSTFKAPNYSTLYVEEEAKNHPNVKRIIKRFSKSTVIEVENYKNILNRFNQDFQLQKETQRLILALKKEKFIYTASPDIIGDIGQKEIHYASTILNCIYHCDYCYLQGVYPSAYPVIFVNTEDFIQEAKKLTKEKQGLYLAISYDSDLMAFENIVPHTATWIKAAQDTPEMLIEVRTKSANYKAIQHLTPVKNVILAWTLSPEKVTRDYEAKTASLKARINCVKQAVDDGWQVRVCIDPILKINDWEPVYSEFIKNLFSDLGDRKLYDVCINVFRMNQGYLKNIQKQDKDSDILYDTFEVEKGKTLSYPQSVRIDLLSHIKTQLQNYLSESQIHSG